jgi:hypothetical protein
MIMSIKVLDHSICLRETNLFTEAVDDGRKMGFRASLDASLEFGAPNNYSSSGWIANFCEEGCKDQRGSEPHWMLQIITLS